MKLYGLTGGIGMGKSASEKMLRERGIPVVDTDALARRLVEPGQPALKEIEARFGGGILDHEGRLRREELAGRVFADATARKQLEEILHPRIHATWQAEVKSLRDEGAARAVVIIPLLFETGAEKQFDSIVCVACSAATQRRRLKERGWDDTRIGQRIVAQWPIGKKIELAHFVVWTEGGLDVHAEQLERVIP